MTRSISNLDALPSDDGTTVSGVTETLVVFVDHTECCHLRWLKKGFRHCFVALRAHDRWIIFDSLKTHMECSLVDLPMTFDLAGFYRERGHTVVIGRFHHEDRIASLLLEPLTCVTVAKRIIGMRSFWTFTPWQLFCRLVSKRSHWQVACSGS